MVRMNAFPLRFKTRQLSILIISTQQSTGDSSWVNLKKPTKIGKKQIKYFYPQMT